MDIRKLVAKHHEAVIALRRYFHTYPELGGEEFNTQKKVMEECTKLGLTPRRIAGTGVIADLAGAREGKTIAIRADMDALPVKDECEQPYHSQNHGVCHACGHDGHTAMLLGVAKVLTDLKDTLSGRIRFLFQPSEERFPCGAPAMIDGGALEGVDAILGAHLWQPLPVGTIGTRYDNLMAATDQFTVKIQGRGGHGSMPQQTVDALLTGAEVVVGINTIVSRNLDPSEIAVISTGIFKSGDVFNIIPDTAYINGTVRSFNQTVREKIFAKIEQVATGICASNGAECVCEPFYGLPPLINDRATTETVVEVAEEVMGKENVKMIKPVLAGEDFAYYLHEIPGAFMFIGAGNQDKGIIYPQHHPKYDIDENALAYGMEVMARSAVKLLGES